MFESKQQVGLQERRLETPSPLPLCSAPVFLFAPHGAPTQYCYGNKLCRTISYNSRLQMNGYLDTNTNDGSQLLNVTLDWGANNNGNLQSATYHNGGPGYPQFLTFQQTYGYDNVNRLNSVSDTGGWIRGFCSDPYGNIWVTSNSGVTLAGNTPTANVYTTANRINAGSYDLAGKQTIVNGNTLAYDAESRQSSITTATQAVEKYLYDGDGHRVKKVGPSVSTVYVYDALGQLAAEYSTATITPVCTTCYLVWDNLGSTRLVTDQNAAIVSRHDYLPFGEEIAGGSASRSSQWGSAADVTQKFTGKERDYENTPSLDYFGTRYYGSALGRFVSPDDAADTTLSVPIPYSDLEDPQSLNLYSYVRNNPLRYTDPDGHDYRVCVANGSGGQQCVTLNDDQYQQLFNQQNGKQGINLPGGPAGGSITCGGANCGSVSYTENSLYDPLPGIVVGAMAGQGAGLALRGVGGFVAGLSGRTAGAAIGETASQTAAKVLLSGGGKQAAKEVIEGLAEGAQKASAKRAVAAATKSESISISQSADGTLSITRTRPGFDGSQTFTKTISPSGASSTVQTAHDAAGNLVHYDPKN